MREGNGDIVEDGGGWVGVGSLQQERKHRTLCVCACVCEAH